MYKEFIYNLFDAKNHLLIIMMLGVRILFNPQRTKVVYVWFCIQMMKELRKI